MKVICIFHLERKIICIYTYIFIHIYTYIHKGISSYNYHAQSLEWCPTLCEPISCSLPGSSVHGIFQARILKWVTIPSSRDLPNPGFEPVSPALQVHSLLLSHWEASTILKPEKSQDLQCTSWRPRKPKDMQF